MGKKSLTKSTTKKKTTAKKKTAAPAAKTAKKKKAPAKPKSASKKAAAKKAAPKKAAPKKAAPKKAAPKKAAPKKVAASKPTVAELLRKKFDVTAPSNLYVPPTAEAGSKKAAPPFFASDDSGETARVKDLLMQKFDMAQIAESGRKAAAEKAAAEKAAAEKAAAEKAAAEKAAAEKAAAEKAAAEKAAAEKAAAEKAAAEKAAAEKAAAEKAAAEKAAAEKAAAEKLAAEKAAAEKAAAERKAAAEKAAAEKVNITYDESAGPDPVADDPGTGERKMLMGLIGAVAFVFLLIIGGSMVNSGKFYLRPAQGGLEIWQGKFAPKGQELLMTLPGVTLEEPALAVYGRKDVYPLIFNYYLEKADTLLQAPGLPDLEGIRTYLNMALPYAANAQLKETAYARLDGIERLILLYKADVAGEKKSIPELEAALGYLAEARKLIPDETQAALINQKEQALVAKLDTLRAEAAAAEAAALAEAEAQAQAEAEAQAAAEAKAEEEAQVQKEEAAPAGEAHQE